MQPIRPTIKGRFPKLEDGVHTVALGNMTQFEILKCGRGSAVFIGIIGKGCYSFTFNAHPSYVEEKLKVMGGDAENLCDFINCQLRPDEDHEDYETKYPHNYIKKLCEPEDPMNQDTILYDLSDKDLDRCDGHLYEAVQAAGYDCNVRALINQWNCWNWTVGRFLEELKGVNA